MLPKWARAPPPSPPPSPPPTPFPSATALLSVACMLFVILRLWRWHASHRARLQAMLQDDETEASRSAVRKRLAIDNVQRSQDVTVRLEGCVALYRQKKYIEAFEDLEWLRAKLPLVNRSIGWPSKEQLAARRLEQLAAKGGELFLLEKRGRVCHEALETFTGSRAGWDETIGADGTKVSSRLRDMPGPNNLIDIKVEAVLDGIQCAHTLMCFREGDLYPSWFPFCSGGSFVLAPSATEVILHLVFEVNFYGMTDLCIEGFGCDGLRDGYFLLCVRHCGEEDAHALAGREVALPPKPNNKGKLFKLGRVKAIIDIMVEPLSPTSVRFSYSCTQPTPKMAPSWIISLVMRAGMGDLFSRMKRVCAHMGQGDTSKYPIVRRLASPSYQHVVKDLTGRVDGYLARMGWA